MNQNKQYSILRKPISEYSFYIITFIILWTYIWLRAVFTQLTHDEIASFFRYVQIGKFLPYNSEWSANNHILNSFFTYISWSIFGPGTLAFRLPNLLAFPFFFYFLVRMGQYIKRRFLRISFVLCILLVHNFLEFFAMSRGYGISMAFIMGSLWYFSKAMNRFVLSYYFLCLFYAFMAVTANLTLFNTWLTLALILSIKLIVEQIGRPRRITWFVWIFIVFIGILPIVFYSYYIFDLSEKGQLYYGELSGFWEVTIKTLVKTMLESQSPVFEIFIVFYSVFIGITGLYLVIRKFVISRLFDTGLLFFYLLTANVIAAVLLRHLFDINYPEDRTGLYFIIYFIGSIFFLGDKLSFRVKPLFIYILVIPLLYIPVHFFQNTNLSHNSFENHKIPERFYNKVMEDYTPGEVPPTIGGRKGREFRWAFLNYSHGGNLGKVHASIYPSLLEDFQVVDVSEYPEWLNYYDSIDYHPVSNFHLLKRKSKAKKRALTTFSDFSSPREIQSKYHNLLEMEIDSMAGTNLYLAFDINFNTKQKPFKSWLVASVRNSEGQEIRYEYFALDWTKYNWEGEHGKITNGMIIPLPEESSKLIFYIWNIQQIPYWIEKGEIKIYVYADPSLTKK